MAKPKPAPPAEPKIETIPLDDLVPDPANLRVHGSKNSKAVTGSLRRFGPWRSVAIDQGNVIYAGNETARAAKEAGYTEVLKVTPKPGQLVAVCREDMTETEKTAYGIADNQTGLIDDAVWAPELPAALQSLEFDGFELEALGFEPEELSRLLGSDENIGDGAPKAGGDEMPLDEFGGVFEDGFVPFKFGDYSGRVGKDVYDSFVAAYKSKQGESGEPMLDDVMRCWLGL